MAFDFDKEPDHSPESIKRWEKTPVSVGAKESDSASSDEREKLSSINSDSQTNSSTGTSSEEQRESDRRDGNFSYRKEKPGKAKGLARGWMKAQKTQIMLGIGGVVATFVIGILMMYSGPASLIAFGRMLEQFHFTDHSLWVDTSVGRIIKYARTADRNTQERRNMGFLGNTLADGYEIRLAGHGMELKYNAQSRVSHIDIDTNTRAGQRAADTLRQQGVDLTTGEGGVVRANLEGTSARARRKAVTAMVNAVGMNKITAAVGARTLRVRAGVDFHPLKNLARRGDERVADFYRRFKEDWNQRIKNGVDTNGIGTNISENTENADGTQREPTAEGSAISGEGSDFADELKGDAANGAPTSELSSKFQSKLLTRGSGAAGAIALICGLQKIGDSVGHLRHVNVILPLMRIGMSAVTTSSQTASNLAFNVEELGAAADVLYDEATNSSAFSAASIQNNLGQTPTGPRMPESSMPGTEKPAFFKTLDNVLDKTRIGNTLCSAVNTTVGGWLIDVTSWVTGGTGPVSAAVNALFDIGTGYFIGMYVDDLVRWLVNRQLEDFPEGALFGNYADTGAFIAANDAAISSGAIELSASESTELGLVTEEHIRNDLRSRSFMARVFDAYDPNSLFARAVIMKPQFASLGNFASNLRTAPTSMVGGFAGSLSSIFGGRAKAAANWNYGVPKYRFSVEDMDDPAYENPYEVANKAKRLGIEKLNSEYGEPCFGTTIDPSTFALKTSATKDFQELAENEKCRNRNNEELKTMRFYIHYMKTAKAAACFDSYVEKATSDEACEEIGFSSGQATSLGNTGQSIANFTGPVIPCQGQPRTIQRIGDRASWEGIPPTGVIGKNSAGQDINVYVRDACAGQTNIRTVVIGASIHGSENGGQVIAQALLFNKQLPPDVRIIAIPEINGAGVHGQSPAPRFNANGVNLNRNFDYRWNEAGRSSVDWHANWHGSGPASEPETKAIQAFLTDLGKSNLVISYHDNTNWVAPSGPNSDVARPMASRYAALANHPLLNNNRGFGFFEAWYAATTDTPALLVELSSEISPSYLNRHADALVGIINDGTVR